MWMCTGDFSAGPILTGDNWNLALIGTSLRLNGDSFDYDIEDAYAAGPHTVAIQTASCGTRIFLDGYECWSTKVTLSKPAARQGQMREIDPASDLEIRDLTPLPTPLVSFASMQLAAGDAALAGKLSSFAIHARFRVRGRGQYGTILAASNGDVSGAAPLKAYIDSSGISVQAGSAQLHAPGFWADGRWHHLTISFRGGEASVWVDGWMSAQGPGMPAPFTHFFIGQDASGQRLMGEVGRGGIYRALSDQQIALLARRAPLSQVPVFDQFPTGDFHRIPALTRTTSGTLLAFADRRRDLPNDAPNATDLVMSRSVDEGATWSDPQVLLAFPGEGADGVAVTDAAGVEDSRGRIHLLFDFYAAHTGLLTAAPGPGMDESGLYCFDEAGRRYVVENNWPGTSAHLLDTDGEPTHFTVDNLGNLFENTEPRGNILVDAPILLEKTAHIATITSDDDGQTWSSMRLITSQVKEPWMTFLGVGPGNGIRLRAGENAGRLLVPCYFSTTDGKQHSAAAFISDDDGQTWYRSASANESRGVDVRAFEDPALTMTESVIVELADSLLMFSRSQHPHVLTSRSYDGGLTWTEVAEDPDLAEIFCQPSATVVEGDAPEIAFANASRMLPYRGCGTVYRGMPGKWVARAINPRHHGYQSLAALPGGDVAMLWERETAGVWFTRVPAEIFAPRE